MLIIVINILHAHLFWTSVLQSSCCYKILNASQLQMLNYVKMFLLIIYLSSIS